MAVIGFFGHKYVSPPHPVFVGNRTPRAVYPPNAQAFAHEGNFFSSLDDEYRRMNQEELSTAISLLGDRHGQFSPHFYKTTFQQVENFQRKGEHAAAVNAFRRCQHLVHRADGVYPPTQSWGSLKCYGFYH